MTQFKNDAKAATPKSYINQNGAYHYDQPSDYLKPWSRLFQAVISQAGTYLLKGKFHTHECGIYKTEGGCWIEGVGELVLSEYGCYFGGRDRPEQAKLADLITTVVLAFNPMDPINSLICAAASHVGVKSNKLKAALDKSSCGGAFGGDALWAFFGPNRKIIPDPAYRRYCMVKIEGKTDAHVDQIFADEILGKKLYEKLREVFADPKRASHSAQNVYCCSPRRGKDGVSFWVNTGRQTQVDGWKTQAELEKFIKSNEKIVDKARY